LNERGPDVEPTGARRLKHVNLNDRGPEAQKAFDALYGIGPVTASKLMEKGSYTDINLLVKDLKLPEDSPSRWTEKAPPTVSLTGEIEWE
jgi:hypothetical protein